MLLQLVAQSSQVRSEFRAHSPKECIAPAARVTLLWSVRSLQDAFLLPQLRVLVRRGVLEGLLRIVVTVTRQQDDELGKPSNTILSLAAQNQTAASDLFQNSSDLHSGFGSIGSSCASSGVWLKHGRIDPELLQRLCTAHVANEAAVSSSLREHHSLVLDRHSTSARVGCRHAFVCGPPHMTE
jgi:NAD(P)H-flavin reductase